MQGKEVVALDDKIIRTREMLHWMLALFVVTLEVGEHFWLGEAVHLVGSQRLVPKNLGALSLFLGLPTFKHAVLVRPCENHLSALADKVTTLIGQTNLVLKHRVAATQKLGIGNETLKFHLVEDHHTFHVTEECTLHLLAAEKFFD